MRIFVERFILTILASFVVLLAAVNPMVFSWPLRLISIIFIVVVAGMAAHFAGWDEWRWQRLRGVWWFWSIFGLSGGVALALWLTQLIVGSPKSEDRQVVALQSELNATKKELQSAKQALETARQPMTPPVRVFLNGGIGLVENMLLKVNLEYIFSLYGHVKIEQPPNYNANIDAPRLPDSGYSGVIIHGQSDAQELIDNFFRDCFVTRQATKTVDGLPQFYKVRNVVWIEIGKGSPWKSPSACWD